MTLKLQRSKLLVSILIFLVLTVAVVIEIVFNYIDQDFLLLRLNGYAVIFSLGFSFIFLWLGFKWSRWLIAVLLLKVSSNWFFNGQFMLLEVMPLSDDEINYTELISLLLTLLSGSLYIIFSITIAFSQFVTHYIDEKNKKGKLQWSTFLDHFDSIFVKSFSPKQIKNKTSKMNWRRFGKNYHVLMKIIFAIASTLTILIIATTVFFLISFVSSFQEYSELKNQDFWKAFWGIIALTIVIFFTLIFLFALPFLAYMIINIIQLIFLSLFSIPIIFRWKDPARILLLRPFQRKGTTRMLRKILLGISSQGHIYTLADADIKTPWYIKIPVFLGQYSFLSFRLKKIYAPFNIMEITKSIQRTRWRNLNWCLSPGKIFPVSCTNDAWKAAVSTISQLMDIILIDLSDIKEGVLWEIEQCKRLNQLDSIIFLVDEKESSTASSFLTNNLDNHFFQLFEYYPNGLTDPSGFYNAIKNKTEKVNQTLKLQVNENSKSELGFQSKSTIKDKLFAVLIIFITIGSLYIFNPSLEGFAVYPEKSAIEKRAKSVIADTIFDIESGLIENLFTNRQSKYIGILASRNKVSFLDITTNQILNTSVSDSLKTNSASFFPGSNVLVCGGHWSSDYPVSLWRISEDHIESVLIRHKPWMRTKTLKGINKIDFGFKPEILLLLSDKYCYSLDPKSAFIIDSVESMDAIDMVFREKDSTLITITDEGQILYRKVNAEGSISRQYKARMLYFPNRSKIFIDERGQFLIYRDTNERDLVIWDTYLQEKRFSFDYSGYIGIEDACFIDKDHLATTIGHVTIIHQLLTDRTYKLDHPSSLESMVYCHQNNNLYGVTFSAKMVIWNLDFLFDKTIQEH